MRCFVDRLQRIDPNLPLRTIPLEVQAFSPVLPRLKRESVSKLLQSVGVISGQLTVAPTHKTNV